MTDSKSLTDKLPTEKRKIKYEYSPIEIHELSLQLANKTREFQSETEEKKTITSQYAAKLNEIKATQNKLSNQVADGYELREVEFTIAWHKPSQGMKTLSPINGGDDIIEKMTQWDHNLFTQYNEVDDDEKKTLNDRQTKEAGSKDKPEPWAENITEEEKNNMLFSRPGANAEKTEVFSTDAKPAKAKSPFKEDNMTDGIKKQRSTLRGKKGGKK